MQELVEQVFVYSPIMGKFMSENSAKVKIYADVITLQQGISYGY